MLTKKEIRKQVKDELERLPMEVYHERSIKLTNKIQRRRFGKVPLQCTNSLSFP